jgi:hypothetical protein
MLRDGGFVHACGLGGTRASTGPLKLALDFAFCTTAGIRDGTPRDCVQATLFPTIDRIEFIRHAARIWKKPAEDTAQTIADMKRPIEQSGSAINWFCFVHYTLDHGGPPAAAVFAARTAIELGDDTGLAHWRLREALDRNGDQNGALVAAEQALALQPGNKHLHRRIAGLEAHLKR